MPSRIFLQTVREWPTAMALEHIDLIVIGAGPAGISMAVEARTAGVSPSRLLVLEKAAEHSFTLKRYYPENKLVTANYKGIDAVCTGVLCMPDLTKHEAITYLDRALREHEIHVRYGQAVRKLFRDPRTRRFVVSAEKNEYEATVVVIAIGILGKPNRPDYPTPRTLRDRFLFDITSAPVRDADVLVVGGGDSASEYCQYLVQQGNRVALSYRRTEFVRMNRINLESVGALHDQGKVELLLGSTIVSVADAAGRPAVTFADPALGTRKYDYVVYALGGSTPENFLRTIGIEFNGEGPRLKEGYETTVPGLFLVGDLSAGSKGGSLIWAFNSANTAMRKICGEYLTCTNT